MRGIKFSSYHLFHMWQMLQLDSGRLSVLSGNDEVMLGALAMGAHGAIGLTLNLCRDCIGICTGARPMEIRRCPFSAGMMQPGNRRPAAISRDSRSERGDAPPRL